MNEPKQKAKQKVLLPETEIKTEDGQPQGLSLQEKRDAWLDKILNERYPKVEYKDNGFLTPDQIAEKPEVWDEW